MFLFYHFKDRFASEEISPVHISREIFHFRDRPQTDPKGENIRNFSKDSFKRPFR